MAALIDCVTSDALLLAHTTPTLLSLSPFTFKVMPYGTIKVIRVVDDHAAAVGCYGGSCRLRLFGVVCCLFLGAHSRGVAEEGPGVAEEGPGVAEEGPGLADEGPGVADEGPGGADEGIGVDDRGYLTYTGSGVAGGACRIYRRESVIAFAHRKRRCMGNSVAGIWPLPLIKVDLLEIRQFQFLSGGPYRR